ncbi:MAG: chlorite dismutase family protein, partial [Chloroflexi bacterium]|nr:chlorite dismutase family protein [Chloroflexota bacterium]
MTEGAPSENNGQTAGHQSADSTPSSRQCVKYSFYRVDPAFRRLPEVKQRDLKLEFIGTIRSFNRRMLLRSYSLFGLRGDVDFMLWQVAEDVESFNALAMAIFSTDMGPYLHTPHSFLAMTRKSQYDIGVPGAEEADRLIIQPGDAKYLFVYPFVKTRAWYALSLEDRQRMMTEHIRVGRKYPQIKLNTTYSFGLDDQEFVVAFEGNRLSDFLDLVMDLRETEASRYTLRDTPTFTCINMGLAETLDSIGGVQAAALAGPDTTVHTGWVQALPLQELPPGTSTKVYLGTQLVALFNVAGQLYAISNRCPHARGPLCEGKVDDDSEHPSVLCPWHHALFDLETGEALAGPVRTPVLTFAVRVGDDGYVYVAERS